MTRRPVIPVRPPPKPLAERLQGRDRVALLQQGLKAHREGRLQDALRSYRQVLDIDPEHLDALRLSGLATMHSGDPAAALTLFDRAMRVDARNASLLNDRGVALQLLGRLEEAVASHGHAVEIKPDFAEACFNRGNAMTKRWRATTTRCAPGPATRRRSATAAPCCSGSAGSRRRSRVMRKRSVSSRTMPMPIPTAA
jgi:Flp pilus assembly protein TadD